MEVFRSKDRGLVAIFIKVGSRLSGHREILHGGVTALLLDNAFGWAVYLLPSSPLGYKYVTAHLGVDYRSQGAVNDVNYVVFCEIDRVEKGRKLYLKGAVADMDSGRLVAEGDALFIALQSEDKELYNQLVNRLNCVEKDIYPNDESITCLATGK